MSLRAFHETDSSFVMALRGPPRQRHSIGASACYGRRIVVQVGHERIFSVAAGIGVMHLAFVVSATRWAFEQDISTHLSGNMRWQGPHSDGTGAIGGQMERMR